MDTLTRRVRCLSMAMVAHAWWPEAEQGLSSARRRLRQLEGAELVLLQRVFARPLIPLAAPVVRWRPGEPRPDFAPIAHALQHRFAGAARQTMIAVATPAAARRYGAPVGHPPRAAETTHDLGLASVYLQLLRTDPQRAQTWVFETQLAREDDAAAQKLPDALVVEPDGRETVIEFGGEYGKAKLAAFHRDCAGVDRGYEVW